MEHSGIPPSGEWYDDLGHRRIASAAARGGGEQEGGVGGGCRCQWFPPAVACGVQSQSLLSASSPPSPFWNTFLPHPHPCPQPHTLAYPFTPVYFSDQTYASASAVNPNCPVNVVQYLMASSPPISSLPEDYDQQQKAAEAWQPGLTGPAVSSVKPTQEIAESYKHANNPFTVKTKNLCQTHPTFRAVRGDRLCGWRAIAFGYLECLHRFGDISKCDEEITRLQSLKSPMMPALGHILTELYEDYLELLTNAITAVKEHLSTVSSLTYLEQVFESTDEPQMLYLLRLLTSFYMRTHSEDFAPSMDRPLEDFCSSLVEPPSEEIEHLGMTALNRVLLTPAGFGLEVLNLHMNPGETVDYVNFLPSPASFAIGGGFDALNPPVIRLLFTPGHYDLIYKKLISHDIHVARVKIPEIEFLRTTPKNNFDSLLPYGMEGFMPASPSEYSQSATSGENYTSSSYDIGSAPAANTWDLCDLHDSLFSYDSDSGKQSSSSEQSRAGTCSENYALCSHGFDDFNSVDALKTCVLWGLDGRGKDEFQTSQTEGEPVPKGMENSVFIASHFQNENFHPDISTIERPPAGVIPSMREANMSNRFSISMSLLLYGSTPWIPSHFQNENFQPDVSTIACPPAGVYTSHGKATLAGKSNKLNAITKKRPAAGDKPKPSRLKNNTLKGTERNKTSTKRNAKGNK